MYKIANQEFGGERPLYCARDLYLENVTVHAGESALKETANITAENCVFEGKYPFWICDGFIVRNCLFREGARAALWYSKNLQMSDTRVEAPKMFREMDGITLKRVVLAHAGETLWSCRHIDIEDVEADGADYLFMHSSDIKVKGLRLNGNYSFQWARDVVIRDDVFGSDHCPLEMELD